MEIMFFDVGTFAEGEVRWRHATSIRSFLESELCFSHLSLEVFVDSVRYGLAWLMPGHGVG